MHHFSVKRPLKVRPRTPKQGEISFGIRAALFRARDEIALGIRFISDRKLFGLAYWHLQPDFFDVMAKKSGVLISPFVPTRAISSVERPGDIDLLIIPYEDDELILSRTLAIETKALRAQYTRQNRSPNQFGFRQGLQLLELGFPYVAVAHLIVSDQSPESAWQEMLFGRVLDDTGRFEPVGPQRVDTLPTILMDRAFGRLLKNCPDDVLGLASAYLPWDPSPGGFTIWHPECRRASLNPKASLATLEAVADFYYSNSDRFLDNPRFDPE